MQFNYFNTRSNFNVIAGTQCPPAKVHSFIKRKNKTGLRLVSKTDFKHGILFFYDFKNDVKLVKSFKAQTTKNGQRKRLSNCDEIVLIEH